MLLNRLILISTGMLCIFALTSCGQAAGLQRKAEVNLLIATLSSPNADVRERTAYELAAYRSTARKAGIELVKLAGPHEEDDVRIAAVYALRMINSDTPGEAEICLDILEGKNQELRDEAALRLRSINTERHGIEIDYPILLNDPNPMVRRYAFWQITGQYKEEAPEEIIDLAVSFTEDESPEVRFAAASKLTKWSVRPDMSVPVLLLELENRANLDSVCAVFHRMGSDAIEALPVLIEYYSGLKVQPDMVAIVNAMQPDDNWIEVLNVKAPGSAMLAMLEENQPDFITVEKRRSGSLIPMMNWDNGKTQNLYGLYGSSHERWKVLDSIRSISDGPEVGNLMIDALSDPDPYMRYNAARYVTSFIGDPREAFETLVNMVVNDTNSIARRFSIWDMHNLPEEMHPEVVDFLIGVLDDEELSGTAAANLGLLGKSSIKALPKLEELRGSSFATPYLMTIVMINCSTGHGLPVINELLESDSAEVREKVVKATWDKGTYLVPIYIEFLDDPSEQVRFNAFIGIRRSGLDPAELLPIYIGVLTHQDSIVRNMGAQGIMGMGDFGKPAIPELLDLLDREVSDKLTLGIEDILEYSSFDEMLLGTTIRALAGYGEAASGAVPILSRLLALNDPHVVKLVLQNIHVFGSRAEEAIPTIIGLLSWEDIRIVYSAELALGKFGTAAKGAVDELALLLYDENPGLRRAAAKALGQIGFADQKITDKLRDISKNDVNSVVRDEASKTLGMVP